MKRHLNDTKIPIEPLPEWCIAIVAARFNGEVVAELLKGAKSCFRHYHLSEEQTAIYRVPGCFEIPYVTKVLAETKKYHAIIAIGAIIKGDTPHFDYVASETARGIAEVSRTTMVPVIFGVLTTHTVAQAWERAGNDTTNNGWAAARAALELLHELRNIPG